MNKQDLKSLLENIYHLLVEAPPADPYPRYYVPGYGFVPFAPPMRYKPTSVVGPNDPPDYLDLWPPNEYMDPWEWLDNNPLGTPGNPYNKHFQSPPYVENNSMNKQDLKSLLENIYTALTEAGDFVGPPAPEAPAPEAPAPETPIRHRPTSSTPIKTFPSFPGDNPADIAEINRLLALIRSGRPDLMGGQSIAVLEAMMRSLIQRVLRARREAGQQPPILHRPPPGAQQVRREPPFWI